MNLNMRRSAWCPKNIAPWLWSFGTMIPNGWLYYDGRSFSTTNKKTLVFCHVGGGDVIAVGDKWKAPRMYAVGQHADLMGYDW